MKILSFIMVVTLVGCTSLPVSDRGQLDDNILVPMPPFLGDCGLADKGSSDCDTLPNRSLNAEY